MAKNKDAVLNETLEHREAFEFYYSLGETRSLQQVSNMNGKSMISMKRWSRAFKWQERVKQRDLELATEMQKKTNHTILVSKVRYREAIATLVEKFEEDVRNGSIKIRNIQDFEKIVKLDMELMGAGVGTDDGGNNLKSLAAVLEQSAKLIGEALTSDTDGEGSESVEE